MTSREPWVAGASRLNKKIHIKNLPSKDKKSVFYLKSHITTEFSRKSQEIVETIKFPFTVDDPSESSIPGMIWYVDRITEALGVFIEFSSEKREGARLHNAKCSFVGGIALGLNRRVLMIVEEPYLSPLVNTRTFVKLDDPKDINNIVKPYIDRVKENLPYFLIEENSLDSSLDEETAQDEIDEETAQDEIDENSTQDKTDVTQDKTDEVEIQAEVKIQAEENELAKITFGSFLAEHEGRDLSLQGYYSDIWSIEELISSPSNLFVGRKGVGKTATLKALKNMLSKKEKTHVCVIEPLNEEMQELDLLLGSLLKSQRTHLIQNVWKSLIYTQLMISLNVVIQKKELSAYSKSEMALSNFIRENSSVFDESLSERLRSLISQLNVFSQKGIDVFELSMDAKEELNDSISESLHLGVIKEVNKRLNELLFDRKLTRIVVLIDNLDKAWEQDQSSYEMQSLWINGLVNTASTIIRDLSRANRKTEDDINFNLFIFLRSDIFYYVRKHNPEPDKIRHVKLAWDSQDKLFQAIDKRISYLNGHLNVSSDRFWNEFVAEKVNGTLTKDFIYERIIPRPRDLIFFLTESRNKAVYRNEKDKKIFEQDIIEAYETYSSWLVYFLKAESIGQIAKLRGDSDSFSKFLLLIGEHSIVNKEEISRCAERAFPALKDHDVDEFIDHLISISILGLETSEGNFEYVYEFDEKQRIQLLSERLRSSRYQRYKIHNALIPLVRPSDVESEESKKDDGSKNDSYGLSNDAIKPEQLSIFRRLKKILNLYLNLGQVISFTVYTLVILSAVAIGVYQNWDLIIDKLPFDFEPSESSSE
jgi:hypothetical protein